MSAAGGIPFEERAAALDAADPLSSHVDRFVRNAGTVYLDGNSLGPLQHAVQERMRTVIADEWGTGLIASWKAGKWLDLPTRTASRIAPLLGVQKENVTVCDSTSVNLFKLIAAAWQRRQGRTDILVESTNFPTDLYIASGAASLLGARIRQFDTTDELLFSLDDATAVVLLTHVDFRTGAALDIPAVTAEIHAQGGRVIWDLSHTAGVFPLALEDWDVDFAVGCGYKFLNGGPGAPSYIYCSPQMLPAVQNALPGWWGHAAPFAMSPHYEAHPDILRFQTGTPPILSLSALHEALAIWENVDLPAVRSKAEALSSLFIEVVESDPDTVLCCVSPHDPAQRGAHAAFRHPAATPVMEACVAQGVTGDVRPPDIVRFGFAPLALTHADVVHAARILLAAAAACTRDA